MKRFRALFAAFVAAAVLTLGGVASPAASVAAPVTSSAPAVMLAATSGNVVCVSTNTRSTDRGAWIRVYGQGGLGWADIPRGRCSTDFYLKNVDEFYVRSGYVAVSQWGWNYQPGVHRFSTSNNKLILTLVYTGLSA
jgi:hypothetical protein